jgi:23S rRNA (adenine2503-C2)-methyltransferase
MVDLLGCYPSEIEEFVISRGEKPYRAKQLLRWIYQRGVSNFDEMTDLSRDFRDTLSRDARVTRLSAEENVVSEDGTVKIRFRLDDGLVIESVLIPEEKRTTLCISSQVGCSLGCAFCRTGRMGFFRNLSAQEIVGQVISAREYWSREGGSYLPVTNIVFMGMGEPLLNYDEVKRTIDILLCGWGFGFSWRRITLSTAGIPPLMLKLGGERLINLAVSLNAPDDDTRNRIMPINKKYPLRELIGALRNYPLKRGRRITLEYVLLHRINDSLDHARALVQLIRGLKVKVNLIPFNPYPGSSFTSPPEKDVLRFQEILIDAHIHAIVRKSKGGEIAAACGQLASCLDMSRN